MPIKCPGLTRRDNSANYRLRIKVPVDLLTHYQPKKELTATLGTSNREEACVRGLAVKSTDVVPCAVSAHGCSSL